MKTLCRWPTKLRVATLIGAGALSLTAPCPLTAATLIYYNGSGSGTSVTNLGTLGVAGNGTVQRVGGGNVVFETGGGPGGAGDAFITFTNVDNPVGAWVNVPAGVLPSFQNTSWSISGAFNRPTTTGTLDSLVHLGNGDYFGQENDLGVIVDGAAGPNGSLDLLHFPDDVAVTAFSVTNGAWHTYALTFEASGLNDGTGTLRLYVDGVLRGSDSIFSLATGATPPALAQVMQWGGVQAGNTLRGFTGGLDDFAFYDFTLSQANVTGLSNGTLTPLTVPEPQRALLVLAGLVALLGRRKR